MKKVSLSGYYGMANYGDDLFAITTSIAAHIYWKDVESVIISPPLGCSDLTYAVPVVLEKAYSSHDLKGMLCRSMFSLIRAISSDHYIFAGGSVFHSGKIDVRTILTYLLKSRKGLFSALGVSVGPFKSTADERNVRTLLKRFAYISVRDFRSYDAIKQLDLDVPIGLSADIAGVVPLIRKRNLFHEEQYQQQLSKVIGFSPCNLGEGHSDAISFCDSFLSAVMSVKDLPIHVKVICLNEHPQVGDEFLCRYVVNHLNLLGINNELVFYRSAGVLMTWDEIARLDVYFSARLHGAITAYMNDVPFFLLEYHQKCTDFLDHIKKHDKERVKRVSLKNGDLVDIIDSLIMKPQPPCILPTQYSQESIKAFTESPLAR